MQTSFKHTQNTKNASKALNISKKSTFAIIVRVTKNCILCFYYGITVAVSVVVMGSGLVICLVTLLISICVKYTCRP